jgi:valyl-tRNA synthetase
VDDENALSAVSSTSYPGERRLAERRTLQRRQSELGVTDANELAALEQRMKDLIDMQREQLETLIRQIIRDELHNNGTRQIMELRLNPTKSKNAGTAHWEGAGYYNMGRDENKPFYCILLPPPNVTGTLHMGHAFQHGLMDALTRYHRMRGDNTLWQPGTDHAGIATQIVVERQLDAQNISRHDLGREKFLEKVWEWKEHSGSNITRQMRRLGTSPDWSRERFTMDAGLSTAVTEVFVRLYNEGLIYRGKRLVNWDPVLQTAVSDLEVVSTEEDGFIWEINYPAGRWHGHTNGFLTVATTRPETLLGDTAVAVNPADERYAHLVGKSVRLPVAERTIPIIADDYVDREFGTGVVKITPAHDFNDWQVGQRHKLAAISVLTLDAKINDFGPTEYQGLDRYVARQKILDELQAKGLLVSAKPHKLMIPRGDRTHAVIEPMLTDQWFMSMEGLAKQALKVVDTGELRFVPENWTTTYRQWLENIQDWCVSRQLWWGHRIPAWYDETATSMWPATKRKRASRPGAPGFSATRMCSTPGSPRHSGRSPPWAGRRTPGN